MQKHYKSSKLNVDLCNHSMHIVSCIEFLLATYVVSALHNMTLYCVSLWKRFILAIVLDNVKYKGYK